MSVGCMCLFKGIHVSNKIKCKVILLSGSMILAFLDIHRGGYFGYGIFMDTK